MSTVFTISLLLGISLGEPNPPVWPRSVYVFNDTDVNAIQSVVDSIFAKQGGHTPAFNGQFSNDRYALLFEPGSYAGLSVNVGYYTSVIGLGQTPSDVSIPNVICENGDFDYTGGALSNFWRSAENFYTKPTMTWTNDVSMLWAVSQAAPMRRVFVDGELMLWQYNSGCCAGYASGGYMADLKVSGKISSGSQQQYYTRNTNMASWEGGVWNMVYQGCTGNPATSCPGFYTSIPQTPIIAEKPFITKLNGKYTLNVPTVETNKVGVTDWANEKYDAQIDFSNVYVTNPSTDTAATINAKLAAGLSVILSPGNYQLSSAIQVTKANTVLLGIGFPTLISMNGNAVIEIGVNGEDVSGVRVGAVLLQAGTKATTTLLQFGPSKTHKKFGHRNGNLTAATASFLYDIFARVGGPTNSQVQQVQTQMMVQINSDNVVFDGSWLWRADHDIGGEVKNSANPVATGLEVNGDNVIAYGLAVEHTLADLVDWNGQSGSCYFYQSEFPYDVTQANYGDKDYVSFRVNDNANGFTAYGMGAYTYFRDYPVTVANGFKVPASGGTFIDTMTIFLNGQGGITHIIDDQGTAVGTGNADKPEYVCSLS